MDLKVSMIEALTGRKRMSAAGLAQKCGVSVGRVRRMLSTDRTFALYTRDQRGSVWMLAGEMEAEEREARALRAGAACAVELGGVWNGAHVLLTIERAQALVRALHGGYEDCDLAACGMVRP